MWETMLVGFVLAVAVLYLVRLVRREAAGECVCCEVTSEEVGCASCGDLSPAQPDREAP